MADNSEKLTEEAKQTALSQDGTNVGEETVEKKTEEAKENNEAPPVAEPVPVGDRTDGKGEDAHLDDVSGEDAEQSPENNDVVKDDLSSREQRTAPTLNNGETEKPSLILTERQAAERKKSEEAKLEALKYAEEYRRKLQMEKEAREQNNADEEALRKLREEEEKNRQKALSREREEAEKHSAKMSALLSKIEADAEEMKDAKGDGTASEEPVTEAVEEQLPVPCEKEVEASQNTTDVSETVEESIPSDEPESMIVSVDMGISSDVLLIDGVSIDLGGEEENKGAGVIGAVGVSATVDNATPEAIAPSSVPVSEPGDSYKLIQDETSSDKNTENNTAAITAAAVTAATAVAIGKAKADKKAKKEAAKSLVLENAVQENAALEADLDIAEGIGSYVEYGKEQISSGKKVDDANKIFGDRERRLDKKEKKRLEREELARFAKADNTRDKAEAEPEKIYDDKEITDDVLIAAGIGAAVSKSKKDKKAKAKASIEEKLQYIPDAERQYPDPVYADAGEEVVYGDPEHTDTSSGGKVYDDKEITEDLLLAAGVGLAVTKAAKGKKNKGKGASLDGNILAEYPDVSEIVKNNQTEDSYPIDESDADLRDLEVARAKDKDASRIAELEKAYSKKELKKLSKMGSEKAPETVSQTAEKVNKREAKKEAVRHAKEQARAERAGAIDKKQIRKFIKQDRQIDMRFISEYYEHLIREKKLEIDSYKMKFNKKSGKKRNKKSERTLNVELETIRTESKKEIRREEIDNKRIYIPLLYDYRTAKVKRVADRGELASLRERLLTLIHERQDLNSKLINLYLGNEDGSSNIYEKRTAAELKGRKKAYKKQARLEKEIRGYHISLSYATKLRSLMDAYVMKYGLLANLKVAIKNKGTPKKARREYKREMRRVKRELKRIEASINRFKTKAVAEARDRRSARRGMFIGWFVFICLIAAGITCFALWDTISAFFSDLFSQFM